LLCGYHGRARGKLERIFPRLEEANFKIKPIKCVFATDTVEYLGHIVTNEEVKPDPRKIQAVRDYPTPRTIRDVRAFIIDMFEIFGKLPTLNKLDQKRYSLRVGT
jgi:hypothetical protein